MTKDRIGQLTDVLRKHTCTLKKASLDEEHSHFMCESELEVVDFDEIPKEYARGREYPCVPKSNDVLYIDKNENWYFVEFKNGKIDKSDIYRKLYDSIIMLMELNIIPDFDFLRTRTQYILVYNSDKYPYVPKSEALESIYSHHLKQADSEKKMFDIWKLEKYLFKETHTYTKELFDERFIQPMEEMEAL